MLRMNGENNQQIKGKLHLGFCPYPTNYRPLEKPLLPVIYYFSSNSVKINFEKLI
jgi:hypothetical protein